MIIKTERHYKNSFTAYFAFPTLLNGKLWGRHLTQKSFLIVTISISTGQGVQKMKQNNFLLLNSFSQGCQ